MDTPVLWQIKVSHYNEKVRWALDLKRIPHRRRAPIPGVMHPVVALAKSGRPTLPVLDLEGRSIADSTAIIEELERRWPDPPLYPADPDQRRRALELEDFFDEEVAPQERMLAFYMISLDPERSTEGLEILGGPPLSGRAATLAVRGVARRYGGSGKTMERAKEKVRLGVERIEAEIQPSGYLVGDSFSVADLTAASLLVHMVRPPEFPYPVPQFPPALEEFRASLPRRGTEWIREIYRRHRHAPPRSGAEPVPPHEPDEARSDDAAAPV